MEIHQFMSAWGLASASPFCLKLQTYCRMAGVTHTVINDLTPAKSPTRKLPYIKTDDGQIIADSAVIIHYLEEHTQTPLDGALSPEQNSQALAYRRLIEESLYASLLVRRWADPDGWAQTRSAFFADLPAPLRAVVPPLVRRSVIKALDGHGRGRHDIATAYAMGKDDLTALSVALGDKPYFLGDAPTSLDASAFGMLAQFTMTPLGGEMQECALALGNLEPYCQRIQDTYFPNEKSGA